MEHNSINPDKIKDQDTLKYIEKLSIENFKLLTPIGDKQEGYYLNYARVYDYLQVFERNWGRPILSAGQVSQESRRGIFIFMS